VPPDAVMMPSGAVMKSYITFENISIAFLSPCEFPMATTMTMTMTMTMTTITTISNINTNNINTNDKK
jgi:hypothetical protein